MNFHLSFFSYAFMWITASSLLTAQELHEYPHLNLDPNATFPWKELSALQDLYTATNGSSWSWRSLSTGTHWEFNDESNPCTELWQGIVCILPMPFDTYHVANLSLNAYSLSGQLPDSIGNLSNIVCLELSNNSISGTIPQSLISLSSLQTLDFSLNRLAGSISDEIYTTLLQLKRFDVGDNYLISTISVGIGNLVNLEYVGLAGNRFTGTIPSTLGNLSRLSVLLLGDNLLSGTVPDQLSQLTVLRVLSLQSNSLEGPVNNSFDATVQSQLAAVDLRNNRLTGTLPGSLLSNHHLQYLLLDNNCFTGTLSDALCGSRDLQVLSLGCLQGSEVCRASLIPGLTNTFVTISPVYGTVPACVWELPALQVLNLAGNDFSGSIPGDAKWSESLSQLILTNNVFTGSIPHSLQLQINDTGTGTAYSDSGFDLSSNRLSGIISTASFKNMQQEQFLNLDSNRLSGHIPNNVRGLFNIEILEGNLFSCQRDRSDLPEHDHHSFNYQCGSDDYNTPSIMWLVVTSIVVALAGIAIYFKDKIGYVDIGRFVVCARAWIICVRDLKLEALRQVREVGRHITVIGCYCAGVLIVIGIPAYSVLTVNYGTYTIQYAWTLSFVLLSGFTPFIFGLILFLLVLIVYTVLYVDYNQHTGVAMRNIQQAQGGPGAMEVYAVCIVYVMVNLIFTAGANVMFVYIVLYQASTLQLAMSMYKVVWNTVCSPYLSRWLVQRLSAKRADFFSLELFVAIMNNVIIPVLSVVFVSPQCFYGVFVNNAVKFVSYPINIEQFTVLTYTEYVFPFRYDYQCSFVYVEYYASAFIYLSIFTSFGIPVVEILFLYCYLRAVPGTYWYKMLDICTPRILKPLQSDPEKIPARNIFRPYFDATKFLIGQLTFLALILSLGVVSPPIAACLAVTMVASAVYTILKIGRFVSNATAANLPQYIELIEQESRGVVTASVLRNTYWIILFFSCFFMAIFLFDVLGDSKGLGGASWVLIFMTVLPAGIYAVYWIVWYGLRLYPRLVGSNTLSKNMAVFEEPDAVRKQAGFPPDHVEMNTVVSPMVLDSENNML